MAQKGVCPVTVFLLAFMGAQAAPIQLASIEAGLRNDTNGPNATFPSQVSESFGRLPLMFEAAGSEGAGFFCRGSGYQLWLSPSEVALTLRKTRNPEGPRRMRNEPLKLRGLQIPAPAFAGGVPETALLRIQLVGADTAARAVGMEQLPTKVNYFLGNDPRRWRTDVAVFGKVRCQNVYPGIDLVYYGNQRQLEYDFVVAPGASAAQIALRFHGAEMMEIDPGGDLILQTAGGPVRQHRPVVYQEWNGQRQEISGRYVLREGGGQEVGFEIAAYDPNRPLTIDPVLVYSTFLGGLGLDRAWAIAVDANGCAYVVGDTTSADFPEIDAAHPSYHGGLSDAVVVKLGSGGTNLIYSTYLGGSGADVGFGIALDGSGNVYLTGLTASPDFPVTTDALSTHLNSRAFFGYYTNDAFVAKLDRWGIHWNRCLLHL